MAKFIKSFFHTSDKKRSSRGLVLDEDVAPPLDDRRKLSISRSGRMKQANRKRRSLCLDLYGDENLHQDKPASKEYHVHGKTFSSTSSEPIMSTMQANTPDPDVTQRPRGLTRRPSMELATSPEEEIDSAFEIIDKT